MCIRVDEYTHVYMSIHTCRGTRHRASTDVTPQFPSDLLLPNLGSALPLNHLHTSLVTAPAFIAAITEICELDRAPTIGRVSRFILHYLPLVLSEGSVPKEEEYTYSKSKEAPGQTSLSPVNSSGLQNARKANQSEAFSLDFTFLKTAIIFNPLDVQMSFLFLVCPLSLSLSIRDSLTM